MKKLLMIFAAVSALSVAAQSPIDVTHYSINLSDVDFSTHVITATTEVSLVPLSAVGSFDLELKNLNVSSVTSPTDSVTGFAQMGEQLTVSLHAPMQVGDTSVFVISYAGVPFYESWGGFHFHGQYAFNLGVGFASVPHNLGKTWFPCNDNFTDRASFDLFVDVPQGKLAVGGGSFVDTLSLDNGKTRWHWSVQQEIPTYLMSVTIGSYVWHKDTFDGQNGPMPIDIFARPSESAKVSPTFANLKAIAAFFEQSFGPHPFNRIGYVGTQLGCMEHVDNIAVTYNLFSDQTNDMSDRYIAHELSHSWFGNRTTCSTAGDMWLNEGFASFCELFYKTGLYDEETYRSEMSARIYDINKSCHLLEGWIPLNNIPDQLTYGETVYHKGSIVVHTMMNYLGRETFLAAIRYYLSKYSYKSASSENLRDALTEYTGVNMNDFFDAWVFTAGAPHYSVDSFVVEPEGGKYRVDIFMRQKHRGADFIGNSVRYEVAFVDSDWNIHTDTVCFDGSHGHSVKHLDFEPLLVLCDYYDKTADARVDREKVVKSAGTYNFNDISFSLEAVSVTDSVYIMIEHNLVAPDSLRVPVQGLHLSGDRYYSVKSIRHSDDVLRGRFTYKIDNSLDGNLVVSDDDTIVLMYRPHSGCDWEMLRDAEAQYTDMFGFYHAELKDGEYTFAAIDRNFIGLKDTGSNTDIAPLHVSPNPANSLLTVRWDGRDTGTLVVLDLNAAEVCSVSYSDTDNAVIDLKGLSSGVYFVRRDSRRSSSLAKVVVK